MSRAYRVKVRESLSRVVRGEDHVGTSLEILEVLPCDEMAELLRAELLRRGFEAKGESLERSKDGVVVEVDPASGGVSVRSEVAETHKVEAELVGIADTDWGKHGKKKVEGELRDRLNAELEKQIREKQDSARKKATDQLEAELAGLKGELDQVVNRVTAEALKRKAARIGQIKEMTEDPEAGSLTIVLEV